MKMKKQKQKSRRKKKKLIFMGHCKTKREGFLRQNRRKGRENKKKRERKSETLNQGWGKRSKHLEDLGDSFFNSRQKIRS